MKSFHRSPSLSIKNSSLTPSTVRKKRLTSTSLSSGTLTPGSRPPLVRTSICLSLSLSLTSISTGHLIYKCGGIDNRTIEKFEKVSISAFFSLIFHYFFHYFLCLCGLFFFSHTRHIFALASLVCFVVENIFVLSRFSASMQMRGNPTLQKKFSYLCFAFAAPVATQQQQRQRQQQQHRY